MKHDAPQGSTYSNILYTLKKYFRSSIGLPSNETVSTIQNNLQSVKTSTSPINNKNISKLDSSPRKPITKDTTTFKYLTDAITSMLHFPTLETRNQVKENLMKAAETNNTEKLEHRTLKHELKKIKFLNQVNNCFLDL